VINIKRSAQVRLSQLLISRITGEVGTSTDISGFGVNQELANSMSER